MQTVKTTIEVEDIINVLKDLGETEMRFETPIQIKTTPHHRLMDIYGVSIDNNSRLWVRSSPSNEVEITDDLIYSQYILGSLNQRLRCLLFFKTELK